MKMASENTVIPRRGPGSRKELSMAYGKYLLATRMSSVKEIRQDVLSIKGRYVSIKDNLKAKEVIIGEGMRRRRYILCYNPKEAQRSRLHRKQLVELLENELSKHKDHNASSRWAIKLLASKRFKRYLSITKDKKIRTDRAKIKEAERYAQNFLGIKLSSQIKYSPILIPNIFLCA